VPIAVLSDVHGNLPALEAVLAEVDDAGIETIVFSGDLAAGPLPRETLDRLLALGTRIGKSSRLSSEAPARRATARARRWAGSPAG
jgi:3',5'-cyclic AMP phosphodiesterase CpdA